MTTEVDVFVALTVRRGIKFYMETGRNVNSGWTPKNMLTKTESITGQKIKHRDYSGAVAALDAWLEANTPKAV